MLKLTLISAQSVHMFLTICPVCCRLRVVFKWLMRAFSGYLSSKENLLLWDKILAYDSLEILPGKTVSLKVVSRAITRSYMSYRTQTASRYRLTPTKLPYIKKNLHWNLEFPISLMPNIPLIIRVLPNFQWWLLHVKFTAHNSLMFNSMNFTILSLVSKLNSVFISMLHAGYLLHCKFWLTTMFKFQNIWSEIMWRTQFYADLLFALRAMFCLEPFD